MGGWDTYCAICGGPFVNISHAALEEFAADNEIVLPPVNVRQMQWLNSIVLLRVSGKPIEAHAKDYDGDGGFNVDGVTYQASRHAAGVPAIPIHKKCEEIVYTTFYIAPKYGLFSLKLDEDFLLTPRSEYGEMAPYMTQYQNSMGIIMDGNEWLLTLSSRNVKRIKDIWRPILKGL